MTEEEFKEREKQISHLRERVGLSEDPHIRPGHESTNRFSWPSFRVVFREPFAELFGTMVMVMFGNGSVAQVLLGGGEINAPGKNGYGSYQGINWGWGIGIFLGIYIAGDSGCYLNPAITMGFCLFRKLPWRRFPIYFLAQCLGGFVSAGVVYANNVNGIDKFEGHGIRNVPPSADYYSSNILHISTAIPRENEPVRFRVRRKFDPHVCHFRIEECLKSRRHGEVWRSTAISPWIILSDFWTWSRLLVR